MNNSNTKVRSTAVRLVLFSACFLTLAAAARLAVADDDQGGPPGGVAVSYQVPTEAPTGEVTVLSLGVAELPEPNLVGSARFVHMRLAAHNRTDYQVWVLDARDQLLERSDGNTAPPEFAESSRGDGAAALALRPGERGYLDLFYPASGDFDPEWTSLIWRLRRGWGAISARTVFERLPDFGASYAHYRPSQYTGGFLVFGGIWCSPWHGHWPAALGPYGRYRRYRYSHRPDGFVVTDGRSKWNYHRERPSIPADTVGTHWRGRPSGLTRPARPTVVAPPAGAMPGRSPFTTPSPTIAPPAPAIGQPAPAPEDRARWRWQVQRVLPPPPAPDPAGPARAINDRSDSSPSWSSSSSSISGSSSSGSSGSSSSSSSSSPSFSSSFSRRDDSPSSSSSSSSSSSGSSSSSPSSPPPSPPASSPSSTSGSSSPPSSSGDSVGSRFRAR